MKMARMAKGKPENVLANMVGGCVSEEMTWNANQLLIDVQASCMGGSRPFDKNATVRADQPVGPAAMPQTFHRQNKKVRKRMIEKKADASKEN